MKYVDQRQVRDSTALGSRVERVFAIVGASLLLLTFLVEHLRGTSAVSLKINLAGVLIAVLFTLIQLRIWSVIYLALVGVITQDPNQHVGRLKLVIAITIKLFLIVGVIAVLARGGIQLQRSFLVGFSSLLLLGTGGLILMGHSRQVIGPSRGEEKIP